MRRVSLRSPSALLLGVFLALGLSLSAVQASAMAVKMTLASDMGDMGAAEHCGGCPDDGGAQAGSCHSACAVAAVAVLPVGLVVAAPRTRELPPPRGLAASGEEPLPDPSPPRAG